MGTYNVRFHKNVMYVSLHFYYVTSIYRPDVGPEGLKHVACL
jgi:hypothetical protein